MVACRPVRGLLESVEVLAGSRVGSFECGLCASLCLWPLAYCLGFLVLVLSDGSQC